MLLFSLVWRTDNLVGLWVSEKLVRDDDNDGVVFLRLTVYGGGGCWVMANNEK